MMNKFQAKVNGVKNLTEDTLFLSLTAPEDFAFQAGQFITLMITNNGETKPRSYSILNPPSKKGKIDLCIKLGEKGFASEIFSKCSVGDEFPTKGPFGHFTFKEDEDESWFICTGTGIVPFYSMLKENLAKFPNKKFKLIWGLRHKRDIFFKEELDEWKEKYPHFDYILTLTRDDYEHTGRVQTYFGNDLENKIFYICGLKELVMETRELLDKSGVPKNKVKFERYS